MRKEHSTGRERPNENIVAEEQAPGRASIGKHLRAGIEAALCANSEMLANCKPRTVLGLIVRALVLEAGKGKMAAVKLIVQIIDREGENEEIQGRPNGPSNSLRQGISQGILKKVAPEAVEQTAPLNRQRRRRLAAMMRQREKEEARLGQLARAA